MGPTDDHWVWEAEPDPPYERLKAAWLAAWRDRIRSPEMTVVRCAVFLVVTHVVAGVTFDGIPTPGSLREVAFVLSRGFGNTAALAALAAGLVLLRINDTQHSHRTIRAVLVTAGAGALAASLSQMADTIMDEEALLTGAEWLAFSAFHGAGIALGLAIIGLAMTRTERPVAIL